MCVCMCVCVLHTGDQAACNSRVGGLRSFLRAPVINVALTKRNEIRQPHPTGHTIHSN